ncbi:receptor like protein 22-like [Humulus lupulus]|uniref:receptor like protein 22-like n=1 Tax=Humulus lupulus TaxID=3486 RepID=UPI002B40E6AB|nr:receptor like protein 22-like [Humulus lupulus]
MSLLAKLSALTLNAVGFKAFFTPTVAFFPLLIFNLLFSPTMIFTLPKFLLNLGEFPETIFNLPNLQGLDLSYNTNLNGTFPQYNWSSPLEKLSLSHSRFFIDLPYLTRNLKYLTTLSLAACNFVGLYPTLLHANLTQITSLDLSFNNLGGQIPWSSLNLQKLIELDLSSNNFIGQLPEVCSSNSTKVSSLCISSNHDDLVGGPPLNLKSLNLSTNKLSGTIPSWLYSLQYLQELDLSNNNFTGSILEFQSDSLLHLDLQSNKLEGIFPSSIFELVNLSFLFLSSNKLSGVVSLDQFSKFKSLEYLDLSFNSLSVVDSINNVNSTLPSTLFSLALSSCGLTEFPYSLRNAEKLGSLELSYNQIEGAIPSWLWNVGKDSLYFLDLSHNLLTLVDQLPWKNLRNIDLCSNQLQGHLPIPPPSTLLFLFANNQLVGEIPSMLCNLTSLTAVDLSNNSLSGNIPPCLGNSSKMLSVLCLQKNNFHGIIPPIFAKKIALRNLNLNGNQLEGSLPLSLFNCKKLEILDVANNKIHGSFPHWLESLPNLQVLILRSNRFHGPISKPSVRFPFQRLRIMDVSNNEFMGLLPKEYFENFVGMMNAYSKDLQYMGRFIGPSYYHDFVSVAVKGFYVELVKIQSMFITIDFSRNNFIGEIPNMIIGKLYSLKGLNLSHNKLSGNIPPSLGNLSNLEWLDLSSNEFVGTIPWQLAANLNQLEFLNLSMNKLEGQIPRGPQFNTFNDDSYSGNLGLCGFPLSKTCNEGKINKTSSPEDQGNGVFWKVVLMGYGTGIVIGSLIGYVVLTNKDVDQIKKSFRSYNGI